MQTVHISGNVGGVAKALAPLLQHHIVVIAAPLTALAALIVRWPQERPLKLYIAILITILKLNVVAAVWRDLRLSAASLTDLHLTAGALNTFLRVVLSIILAALRLL